MIQYLDALKNIMENGVDREDKDWTTRSLFALHMRFDLADGFPAVTTKKLAFKSMKGELLWFLEGSRNEHRLREIMGKDRTIWTDNVESDKWRPKAEFDGDTGRIYGIQWRKWRKPDGSELDQLGKVIEKIKNTPNDRRLIVTAWNPGEVDAMALPPCHMIYQFYVAGGRLHLHMLQRSADMFLGVPFNIASYSLLLHMVAQVTGYEPGEAVFTFNDAHIYYSHFEAVQEQLKRTPHNLPALWLNPEITNIDSFGMDDIKLENYEHDETIKAEMVVTNTDKVFG